MVRVSEEDEDGVCVFFMSFICIFLLFQFFGIYLEGYF